MMARSAELTLDDARKLYRRMPTRFTCTPTTWAVCSFFAWLDQHGIGGLVDIEPFHVAAYIKALKVSDAGNPAVKERAAARPTVKQHLAAIRMLRGSGPEGLPR
jgi:hypothetical protein